MPDSCSSRERGKHFAFLWILIIMAIFLSMSLSACITLLDTNCSGLSVSCNSEGSSLVSPDATAQARAVATVTAIKKRKPLVNDPLSKQNSRHWPEDNHCFFEHGAYFVESTGSSNGTYTCFADKLYYHDVAVQMDVKLIIGDSAGIMFRATPDTSEFYEFMIGSSQFLMGRIGPNDAATVLAPPTSSNAIHGPGTYNRLLVIMQGSDFWLFINGTYVGEAHDSTLATGFVGLSLAYNPNGEASFSNLVIYPV